jgi:hypothetical protein
MQGTQTNDNCTIDSTSLKVSDIRTQKVKINGSGGKSVKTSINGTPIYIQLPIMKTWGVNLYIDEKTKKKSYEIPYQFPDKDELVIKPDDKPAEVERKNGILKLWETLAELDEWVFQQGVKNCQEWFGIPNDQEGKEFMVRSKHKTILKYPKDPNTKVPDKNRPPSFSAKVPYYEKSEGYGKERKVYEGQWEFHTEVYSTNGTLIFSKDYPETTVDPKTGIPIDFTTFLQTGQSTASEVKHGGIYINGGMFGQTLQATQIVPLPLKQYKRGVCHVKIPAALAAVTETESDGEQEDEGVGDENEQFPVDSTPEDATTNPVEKVVENVEVPPSVVENTELKQEPVVSKTVKKRVNKKTAANT